MRRQILAIAGPFSSPRPAQIIAVIMVRPASYPAVDTFAEIASASTLLSNALQASLYGVQRPTIIADHASTIATSLPRQEA